MICLNDQADFVLELASIGDQTAGIKDIGLLPFAAKLVGFIASLGSAGVTGSQIVDIHKITSSGAGTTIFSDAQKITFTTTVVGSIAAADTALTPVAHAAGSLFTLENDGAHSGTAGKHLKVLLFFRRERGAKMPVKAFNAIADIAYLTEG
jgi:hypothetical protein